MIEETLSKIREAYNQRVEEFGFVPDYSLPFETAMAIWKRCDLDQPSVILDLGSGYSSLVFRFWVHVHKKGEVITGESEPSWIEFVKGVAEEMELPAGRFEPIPDVYDMGIKADLILIDHGPTEQNRIDDLPRILGCARSGENSHRMTSIIIDDWGGRYKQQMTSALRRFYLDPVIMHSIPRPKSNYGHRTLALARI